MENGKVKADWLKLKELYNRKGKCGKSKPDCLHGHRLIGVKVSTLSTHPPPRLTILTMA